LSVQGHIPEKDGLLANILVVELIARYKKPLSQIWADLTQKYGQVINQRINLKMTPEKKASFMTGLREKTLVQLGGLMVKEVKKTDGVKLIFEDGSWLLARPSGTEPLVRVYAEADSEKKLKSILEALRP